VIAIGSLLVGIAYFTVAIANPPLAQTLGVGYVCVLATCTALNRFRRG
jgi:hypothetical protein